MSERSKEALNELIERWVEEFARAVEMFTGEKPDVTPSQATDELTPSDISDHTWWKQDVQNENSFSIWAGANQLTWNAVGEGAEAQSTLFEMLSQANEGTAAVLSAGFPVPLRCRDGSIEAPVLPVNAELAQIHLTFRGADAGVIFLLVDKAAFAILNPEDPALEAGPGGEDGIAAISAGPAMLSRLLDLRLPVSVLLGRAEITIKEALKLMPGSVLELDRQVGDYVEIIVHGTVVAKGEIVAVKGNYGVRIKEVISRQDRIALHEAA